MRKSRITCAAAEALNPQFRVRIWNNQDVPALLAENEPEYVVLLGAGD